MSHKGGEMFQIESVRLSINEHLTSVREEISCVVNECLGSVEQFMCSLFQREIETLVETLLERQDKDKLLDVILQPHVKRHRAALLYQCVESSLQVKMSSPETSRTVSVKPEDLPDTRTDPVKEELEDFLDTRTSPVKQELEDLPDTTYTVNPGIAGASTMPAVQANPASDPSTQLIMSASSAADPSRQLIMSASSAADPSTQLRMSAYNSTDPFTQLRMSAYNSTDPFTQLRMSASAAADPYRLLIMPPTADPATLSWSQPPPPPRCVLLPQPIRNTPATIITTRPVPILPAASVKPAIDGPSSRLIMPSPATAGPSTRLIMAAPVTVGPSTRSWPQPPLLPGALLPLPVVGPSTRPIIPASRATPGIVHPSSTQPIMPVSQATPGTSDLSSTQPIMPASRATPGIAGPPTSAPPPVPTTPGAQTGVGSHLSWGKSTYRKRKKMELTELSRCYSRLPLCKLCGRPAQRHRKYKKKTYCPVTMKSSSARLNNRVFGSYENFTSAVDNM